MDSDTQFQALTQTLQRGGIAVVRTDTLYGIIALARNKEAVEKVYTVKHRRRHKACIVLLSDVTQVPAYPNVVEELTKKSTVPTSIVIPATSEPAWVTRGNTSVAYRIVQDDFLKRVIAAVGPVIAPSANPEGMPPARTVKEAKEYFGKAVDIYIEGGIVPTTVTASQIIEVSTDGTIIHHR